MLARGCKPRQAIQPFKPIHITLTSQWEADIFHAFLDAPCEAQRKLLEAARFNHYSTGHDMPTDDQLFQLYRTYQQAYLR